MSKQYGLHPEVDGVEVNDKVIQLCEKYGYKTDKVHLINDDALIYVNTCHKKYDLICIDLFNDDQVPEGAEKENFLIKTKELLKKDGILLINRLYNKSYKHATAQFYKNTFTKAFPNGRLIRLDPNCLLYWKLEQVG